VDGVIKEIAENASTGLKGDGLLTIFDLGSVIRIRSKEEVKKS